MKSSPPEPAPVVPELLVNNPILHHFDIATECSSTAGPGLCWRVHEAIRRDDGKEFSVFVFDKRIADKVVKPKYKDLMLDAIRDGVRLLIKNKHPKFLDIVHQMEEGTNSIAFASEPIIGSLHNILTWHECHVPPGHPPPIQPHPIGLAPPSAPELNLNGPSMPPPFSKEYRFTELEHRYGLLQLIDALCYLHYHLLVMHRNVCPMTITVTKRGTWKLFGLEFIEPVDPEDPTTMQPAPPWSMKVARLSQPELDFLAPEVQINGRCSILSDMFSLGLVICAVFNNGKPLIQANNNPLLYMKQMEYLDQQVRLVLPRVPIPLKEAVLRLLSRDPPPRPTTQLLPLIKYFNLNASRGEAEKIIYAIQFLDSLSLKDASGKNLFFRETLPETMPIIPEYLRWQHVWPALRDEIDSNEVLASVLQSVMWLVKKATADEFKTHMFSTIKQVFKTQRSIQATVCLLEHLHIIMKKGVPEEIDEHILPILWYALESHTFQIQSASLVASQYICEAPENKPLVSKILTKVKALLEKHASDVKIVSLVLCFFEKSYIKFDRSHVLEQVIPTLLAIKISDPEIVTRVVKLFKNLLSERKFGLNTTVMATKMIPSLAPQTINPALNVDQFTHLMEILYDMLESIDRQQRYKLKADNLPVPSPENRRQRLRHQMSTDNMNAPPFNIPNLRVERKTSSAEDMARKNSMTAQPPPPVASTSASVGGFKSKHDEFPTCSVKQTTSQRVLKKLSSGSGIGQWLFGSSNSTNNDNNFLRVSNAFPNRRLSDNTLMTPKIKIAPSCASSPGGTPGSTSGLPTRRHSSIGPQERRGSTVNLSPPTPAHQYRGRGGGSGSSLSVPSTSQCVLARSMIGGSMPNTSSSVPFLLTSSMQSIRSRRPSGASSQGSGILQQLSTGMVRHLPSSARHHSHASTSNNWSLQGATAAGYNALHQTAMAVRKCPSLNITLTR